MKKIKTSEDWQLALCALRHDSNCSVSQFVEVLEKTIEVTRKEVAGRCAKVILKMKDSKWAKKESEYARMFNYLVEECAKACEEVGGE